MHGKRISIICAGFVLIFVFTLLFSNIASAATSADANTITISTCTDSDGGIDYYKVGEVSLDSAPYGIDWCQDATHLEEFYCKDSSVFSDVYACSNGCSNGACLSSAAETGEISATIWDEQKNYINAKINLSLYSDSGSIVSSQGTESGYYVFYNVPAGTYYIGAEDPGSKYSATKSDLFKVYGNTGSAVIITMKLTSPLICENYRYETCPAECARKCVPSSCSGNICTTDCGGAGSCTTPSTTCTDSDGGKDYYIKGTVKGMWAVTGSTATEVYDEKTDSCVTYNAYSLVEYYCSDKYGGSVTYECPDGCSNGACLSAGGMPDLSIYELSTPSSTKTNETFYIKLSLTNKGNALVNDAFLISAKTELGGVQIYDNKFSLALEPNQSAGTALTGYATNAGTYKITIYVDYLNQIAESDESNNSYTFTLEVSAEEKKIVKLGEDFGLNVGEKAYLESENIEIQLTSVNYSPMKCSSGDKCPDANPEAQISITQGNIGTSIMLGISGTANVFGVEIKNTGISTDNWASFVISKETIPGGVTAKLGESFQLEEYQTAKIFSEFNEDLMKITVDDVVVYGDIVCIKAPCEAAEYAQLTVSIASGGVKVIRLGLGGFEYVDKYKITVQSFWTTVEEKAITSILVEKAERPDMITVSLNSGFNLQLHQTALVKETELKITLEGFDVESGTAAFSISLSDGKTDYIKLSTQRKGMNVQEIFGHEITLSNVSKDSASLIIAKKEAPRTIDAYLNDKFSLLVNQTANVYAGQIMEGRSLNMAMNITLQGIEQILCEIKEAKEVKSKEIVRCDSRPVARIMVQSVPSCPENAICVQALPQYISLRESEERAFGNYSIRLLDIGSEKAVFIVKKGATEDIINVHLNEQFDLQTEQTAYVVEEGLNIKLYNIPYVRCKRAPCQGSAEISVWKYSLTAAAASTAGSSGEAGTAIAKTTGAAAVSSVEIPASSPVGGQHKAVATYMINEGETISLYGVEIKLTKASGNAAAFIVTKGSEAVINVHTNEPFKISEQQAANVLEANLRIDILQIDASNSQVEFSTSNYLLSAGEIGKRLAQETYETAITKTEAVAAKVAVTGHAAMQVISMPPMPFETYRLGAGESVDVGEFTIKVLAVGGSSAEFIVTEKNTDLKIKLEIYKGWNLISLPGEIDSESAFDCEVSDWRIFEYNTAENKFEAITQPSFSRAFWLYNPGKNCSPEGRVRKAFPLETIATIEKGWNFIPVLADMLKKKITDFENCEFKAAYFFNANSKKWEKALTRELSESDLGKGIAVYAEEACSLSGEEIEPPKPPEPTKQCKTDDDCEVFYSHCTCSYEAGVTDAIAGAVRSDCEQECPNEKYSVKPSAECVNGTCEKKYKCPETKTIDCFPLIDPETGTRQYKYEQCNDEDYLNYVQKYCRVEIEY